ncbi:hypothetical protein [Legionella saoudiensis]|uniref:hypothetical protein n=1 Tax=Legionella saoudiensis TaxID=1750561 RepID=UPI000B2AB673|nr:hypothetical protein [Legionella saoudiensis]
MKTKKLNLSILALSPIFFLSTSYANESPKEASLVTKNTNNAVLKELPFNDKESFSNASKGLLLLYQIMG